MKRDDLTVCLEASRRHVNAPICRNRRPSVREDARPPDREDLVLRVEALVEVDEVKRAIEAEYRVKLGAGRYAALVDALQALVRDDAS